MAAVEVVLGVVVVVVCHDDEISEHPLVNTGFEREGMAVRKQ